jgi:hypothetical protein
MNWFVVLIEEEYERGLTFEESTFTKSLHKTNFSNMRFQKSVKVKKYV